MRVVQSKYNDLEVYDNCDFKPSAIDTSGRFSIAVLIYVNWWHSAQYEYTTGIWTTLPGGEKCVQFYDSEVKLWTFLPNTPNFDIGDNNPRLYKNVRTDRYNEEIDSGIMSKICLEDDKKARNL